MHEQGSDLAKGLLLRQDKKAIGEQGFFWLLISIASNWAGDAGRVDGAKTDKIPLNDRVHWALDNEEILLSYAENPKVNQGWMSADKCWQFIAACYELKALRNWQTNNGSQSVADCDAPYDYQSHLECYVDGSNNGSQHLAALTLDEITAPHVNLVPLDLPGDLYKYVADHVWSHMEELVAEIPAKRKIELEEVIDTLIDLKRLIAETQPLSDRRKELIAAIQHFKKLHEVDVSEASVFYWLRITDNKHKRKICKR